MSFSASVEPVSRLSASKLNVVALFRPSTSLDLISLRVVGIEVRRAVRELDRGGAILAVVKICRSV